MPRRGENIYKRKDGRWEGRYIKGHSNGKAHYGYVYAYTYADVKQKLSLAVSTKEKQPESKFPNLDDGTLFSTISSEWLSVQCGKIKRSSYVKYLNMISSYIDPTFSFQHVETITRSDITEFCSELAKTGGVHKTGLSPKTIMDILSVMRNIFDYAADIKGLNVPNIRGVSVKASPPAMRVLSCEEQHKLEIYLQKDFTPVNMGILLCLYTGLRIGEVCALTWGDISEDERTVHIHKTLQRIQVPGAIDQKTEIIITAPKSASSIRKIPLPDPIYQIMLPFRKDSNAYLLTGLEEKYLEPRALEKRFKRILKYAEIDQTNFHALRHTFATRCVELGFDVKSLSEILGHASVNITLNRYVHPSMSMKQKNMELLSDIIAVK